MNFKIKMIFLALIHLLASCSSKPKSVGLGASIGLGLGALTSSPLEDRTQANINMAVTALVGGVAGYLIYNSRAKQDSAQSQKIEAKEFAPRLNHPEVHRIWIPDQIIGDEYISGHWKFLISQPAVWSKSESTKQEDK